MKRWRQILLTGLLLMGVSYFAGTQAKAAVPVNEEHFPDISVRMYAESMDKDKDGVLSDEELKAKDDFSWWLVTPGFVCDHGTEPGGTVDFTGMENFTGIETIKFTDVGSESDRWNYADSNLFRYFPYVKELCFYSDSRSKVGVGSFNLTGTSNTLEKLEIYGKNSSRKAVIQRWDVRAENLKSFKMEYVDLSGEEFSMENFSSLEKLEIAKGTLPESGLTLKGLSSLKSLKIRGGVLPQNVVILNGLSSLEYLDLSEVSFSKLNISPVRKTLKTLWLGSCVEGDDIYDYDKGSQELKTLDISQMEKLEKVIAGHTGITKLITKDSDGKAKTKKLKELCVEDCKIKSIDVTGMPGLETLCVYDTLISKLDVTKNKKLNLLQAGGPNLKSINVTKNTKLDTLNLRGNIKNLDLSKNTSLRTFYLVPGSKKAKMTKLTLPMLKKSIKWMWKRFAPGYAVVPYNLYFHKVSTLDLSKITKLTAKTKKYEMLICEEMKLKTVIVSKKLKKSDRNWIQKKAKKAGAKVVVK